MDPELEKERETESGERTGVERNFRVAIVAGAFSPTWHTALIFMGFHILRVTHTTRSFSLSLASRRRLHDVLFRFSRNGSRYRFNPACESRERAAAFTVSVYLSLSLPLLSLFLFLSCLFLSYSLADVLSLCRSVPSALTLFLAVFLLRSVFPFPVPFFFSPSASSSSGLSRLHPDPGCIGIPTQWRDGSAPGCLYAGSPGGAIFVASSSSSSRRFYPALADR